MAKHLSALRRFEVSSDDGGMWIEHRYKDCDWLSTADGYRLTSLMRQATTHAKTCDGKPQPKREPQPSGALNSHLMDLWGPLIKATLETNFLVPSTLGQTGALDAER